MHARMHIRTYTRTHTNIQQHQKTTATTAIQGCLWFVFDYLLSSSSNHVTTIVFIQNGKVIAFKH